MKHANAPRFAVNHMKFDALVLNAPLRQSLVTVRSLGQRGLQVAAAGPHRNTPALSSRWCRQGSVFPPEEALDASPCCVSIARGSSHESAWR